ncbi:MAG: YceH family protein [Opitutaceae bacterium]
MSESPPPVASRLSVVEARVLAVLIEKEQTTPDNYPLSLNATVNACNQKSNRDPVMALNELEVEHALDSLRRRKLVVIFSGAESRVPKFKHSFDQVFPVGLAERVVLCELILRGPQTPGELRGHCERMHAFADTAAVTAVLTQLMEGPGDPLVTRLERQPGQKEQRYLQLISETPEGSNAEALVTQPLTVTLTLPPEVEERLRSLEETCAELRAEVARLKELILGL